MWPCGGKGVHKTPVELSLTNDYSLPKHIYKAIRRIRHKKTAPSKKLDKFLWGSGSARTENFQQKI